ncbi:MAG: phosphotransferase [Alphaproteobacteria bacterium]|nr:phosphotransferase [Alphaproteobacteria bacterium]
MTRDTNRIGRVREALAARLRVPVEYLVPLPDTGLAHDHVAIGETGTLARVPKQSQMGLEASANLAYQAACFERAGESGHTPRLHDTLPPDSALPMGALVVEKIEGRPLSLPDDLEALAAALAAIHALPLPGPAQRAPLRNPSDPLADTFSEVMAQSAFLSGAGLHADAESQIGAELRAAEKALSRPDRPPVSLIAFDAHPGNYLVDARGRAILVDLEKARYGAAPFDLAHATLYTSTTWDVDSRAVLTRDEVREFHDRWLAAVPDALADGCRAWLLPLRRIMWLWSVTWCAKWRVQSAPSSVTTSTENWSAELSEDALVAHVADRVADYLDPDTIAQVRADWAGADTGTPVAAMAD